jgi:hypothetical protein
MKHDIRERCERRKRDPIRAPAISVSPKVPEDPLVISSLTIFTCPHPRHSPNPSLRPVAAGADKTVTSILTVLLLIARSPGLADSLEESWGVGGRDKRRIITCRHACRL